MVMKSINCANQQGLKLMGQLMIELRNGQERFCWHVKLFSCQIIFGNRELPLSVPKFMKYYIIFKQ